MGVVWGWPPFAVAGVMLLWFLLHLHSTLRGKYDVWSDLLDDLNLCGDERILDLGCGRGAVLLMAAKQLTTGRAVGIDLWRRVDQSGNAIEVTERNAIAEGVRDRVEVSTADMTDLPFPDGHFDVVTSSLAIHNIKATGGQIRAIDEALRVLCPGGRIMIVDIEAVESYRRRLLDRGVSDVRLRSLGWRMWWGGPWLASSVVAAIKPAV
jgi:ubiquinone/menaquinone biosynthesis C-methylase UbiE